MRAEPKLDETEERLLQRLINEQKIAEKEANRYININEIIALTSQSELMTGEELDALKQDMRITVCKFEFAKGKSSKRLHRGAKFKMSKVI